MVSLTVVVRQELGEWVVTATLVETYGQGLEPVKATAVSRLPLTGREWDSDPLWSVLSALGRWSGMTMEDHLNNR